MLRDNPPLITRRDYEGMREGPPYYQVIEGDLVLSPSPTTYHQQIAVEISSTIAIFLKQHPMGRLYCAPLDVFLSDTNVYQPDLLYVSREHESQITDHGIEGAPDLVIEILSPSTANYDQGSKLKTYSRTGVEELWLVDPVAKRIQIYDLRKDASTPASTHGPGSVFSSRLLTGLEFKGAEIFGVPPAA